MFDEFPRDEFYFTGNGLKTEIFFGIFSNSKVYIEDMNLPDVDGLTAHRMLPAGREEVYLVTSCRFQRGLAEIPDCYLIELKKEKEMNATYKHQIIINDSKGIQIGDHNTQYNIDSIIIGFKDAIDAINKSNVSEEEKSKAKILIKNILSNPTFAAILGGATGGLLNLLK